MAAVDLQGGDAQRFRDQYQTKLGRPAQDDEITGWLSGQFGGGSVDDRLNQIATSGEAQQYSQPRDVGQPNPNVSTPQIAAPQTNTGTNPYQGVEWWSQQGVPQTQIFNTSNGQPNAGWARTGQGYERTTGNVPGPQNGNFDSWLMQLTQGKPPSLLPNSNAASPSEPNPN